MSDDPTRIIRRRRDDDHDPDKTRIIRHGDEEADPLSEIVSRSGGKGGRSDRSHSGGEADPTRLYGAGTDEEAPTRLAGTAPVADGHTRIHRRPRPAAAATPSPADSGSTPSPVDKENTAAEPTVGWLVIVEGPGRGHSLKLSYQLNSIGRTEENRVPLVYGDEEISRTKHAVLSYDSRGRKFYLSAPNDGINMTYLDDVPLLVPQPLQGGERIRLGQTVLQFVPFCGEHFDWD